MEFRTGTGGSAPTTCSLKVLFVLRDREGMAVEEPEGLRTPLMGVMAARPADGDVVPLLVDGAVQKWRVTGPGEWSSPFPRRGNAEPASVLTVGLVRVDDGQRPALPHGSLVFDGIVELEGLEDSGRAMIARVVDTADPDGEEEGEFVRLQSWRADADGVAGHVRLRPLLGRVVQVTVVPLD